MEFRHERIDDDPPSQNQAVCVLADLTGSGTEDVIIAGNKNEPRIYWYEQPGWDRHVIHEGTRLCVGGALADLTGNGRLDLVVGGPYGASEAYWFEQPDDPRSEWTKHRLCDDFNKYHDQAVTDVDDDGEPEVLLVSQNAEIICYYDIPPDPTETAPWPRSNRTFVAAGVGDAEGIAVLDVDDDGRTEIVVGRRIFHRTDEAGTEWEAQRIAPEWKDERQRVVAADLDDDGQTELVLAEGELPGLGARHDIYHDGRLAICSAPDWEPTVLRDDLHNPHSLQVADFDGDGRPDIYVAESDYGGYENPRHFVYRNQGNGSFEPELIHEGTATHEAKAVDLTGSGLPDIVGKNDTEDAHVDVWYNES